MSSPFIIRQDFLSPKVCQEIVEKIKVISPNYDKDGNPVKLERHFMEGEDLIFSKFNSDTLVDEIQETFDATIRGVDKMVFQYYPENQAAPAETHSCEQAKYVRKKWVKTKDVDLVGFIWLKDYRDTAPIDPRTEVYGGKIEFPLFNFSLVPQAGTLVIFPATPHFITAISPILLGDLYQVKLNIALSPNNGQGMWTFDPKKFPIGKGGVVDSWLSGV